MKKKLIILIIRLHKEQANGTIKNMFQGGKRKEINAAFSHPVNARKKSL